MREGRRDALCQGEEEWSGWKAGRWMCSASLCTGAHVCVYVCECVWVRERETECSSRFLSQQIRSGRQREAPPAKHRIPLLHRTDVYLSVLFACMCAHGHTPAKSRNPATTSPCGQAVQQHPPRRADWYQTVKRRWSSISAPEWQ